MSITRQFYMAAQPLENFKPFKSAWVSRPGKEFKGGVTIKQSNNRSNCLDKEELCKVLFVRSDRVHFYGIK